MRWALLGVTNRHDAPHRPHRNARPQLLEVQEVITHPDYRGHLRYHDIALLRLAAPAQMSEYVRPACLPSEPDDHGTGVSAIATGWGATGDGKQQHYSARRRLSGRS